MSDRNVNPKVIHTFIHIYMLKEKLKEYQLKEKLVHDTDCSTRKKPRA